jgi:hypothetical protein
MPLPAQLCIWMELSRVGHVIPVTSPRNCQERKQGFRDLQGHGWRHPRPWLTNAKRAREMTEYTNAADLEPFDWKSNSDRTAPATAARRPLNWPFFLHNPILCRRRGTEDPTINPPSFCAERKDSFTGTSWQSTEQT